MNKLREKHPEGADASEDALLKGDRGKTHPVIFNRIDGEMVKGAALDTNGSAGPSGMDASIWKMLLTSRKSPKITADLRNTRTLLAKKMCTRDC